jgi:hypothetical protein
MAREFGNINEEHVKNFSSVLTQIMDEEVKAGNRIVESSSGWPEKETIIIFLGKPFIKTYSDPELVFSVIGDPHWWLSEYSHPATKHVLACKYE